MFLGLQLLLFIAYLLPLSWGKIQLPEWLSYSGLVVFGFFLVFGIIALFQINTKLSPFPSPVVSAKLISNGVFKISRHPIYTSLVFSGFGYAIYLSSLFKVLITLIILILFYYKSVYEERLLSQKFSEYHDYKKRTRRFI